MRARVVVQTVILRERVESPVRLCPSEKSMRALVWGCIWHVYTPIPRFEQLKLVLSSIVTARACGPERARPTVAATAEPRASKACPTRTTTSWVAGLISRASARRRRRRTGTRPPRRLPLQSRPPRRMRATPLSRQPGRGPIPRRRQRTSGTRAPRCAGCRSLRSGSSSCSTRVSSRRIVTRSRISTGVCAHAPVLAPCVCFGRALTLRSPRRVSHRSYLSKLTEHYDLPKVSKGN